ncbi:lipoprotein LpqH [Amycolatopsis sp. NPDC003676]
MHASRRRSSWRARSSSPAQPPPASSRSATVEGDAVQAVAIGGTQGGSNGLPYAVGYGNGQPGGSAKLAKDGNTFRITGEGVSADMTNPLAGPTTAKFDITFACTTIA